MIQRCRGRGDPYKKFSTRFGVIDDVDIVKDTRFDDTHAINAPEGVCLQSVETEMVGLWVPYLRICWKSVQINVHE